MYTEKRIKFLKITGVLCLFFLMFFVHPLLNFDTEQVKLKKEYLYNDYQLELFKDLEFKGKLIEISSSHSIYNFTIKIDSGLKSLNRVLQKEPTLKYKLDKDELFLRQHVHIEEKQFLDNPLILFSQVNKRKGSDSLFINEGFIVIK